MPANPFTDHPTDVGESYFEHLRAAGSVGVTMTLGGFACLVHAVLPFVFIRTGSKTISRLHQRINKRGASCDWERNPII